jgi:hypothetical protein
MIMKKILIVVSVLVAISGCFTVKETNFPSSVVTALPKGKEVSVKIQGFAATIVDYMSVYSYDTVWVRGRPRGCHGWTPGHYATVSSSTYVPQVRSTDFFLERARTSAEEAGFVTQAQQPDYLLDVTFTGPFVTDSQKGIQALWMILSIFSADYSVETWSAKIKIYDNKTGKMVFHRDYSQCYEVAVWGPLPILSPAGSSKNTANAMQSWCLTALTDRVMADATAFLVGNAK